ncbi:phage scaffolding protein [Enterococcus faecium]|uniref:phage scaffolding protein n=1 Tax=Enterococcus faecium TaxID=1352 RepID=UPI000CF240D2|nr:phage scaffolding protein [Enterococcus faecium]EGP4986418.1 capsid protein [Enterococcus faecium]EGP5088047.1 capsid protein [Enterococcus faecium]EGP5140148.1 capsid protein [Enterococcus faecium]EME3511517.1 phage scaffolding protein [Enterococcus faecium]EME3547313.1 phage scaffolding protein [Enterococcus faecium]
MKREQLKELGLTDEQINSVMGLHGQTVTELNSKLATAEQERDRFKEQLDSNQTELDALKESVKGNEELTQQLTDLQNKFNEAEKDAQKKLAEQQKDFAIKLALKEVNARDEDIVLQLLNKEAIKVTDEGLEGLKEQLDALKENKNFLFQEKQNTSSVPRIFVGGNPSATEEVSGSLSQQMKSKSFNLTNFLTKGENK